MQVLRAPGMEMVRRRAMGFMVSELSLVWQKEEV